MWNALEAAGYKHIDGGDPLPVFNDEVIDAATYCGYVRSPDGQLYMMVAVPCTTIHHR
jgi:hypothetical protein